MVGENRQFHIVIAEDDLDDQFLFKQALSELNISYESTSVYTGFQLMDLLLKKEAYKNITEKPDLVFLDINMPLMNGFGVLTEIAKYDDLKDIPIYILSTSSSELDKKIAMQLGAKNFFTKPVNFIDLKTIIKNTIKT
jgi:CheY-like chemotaxis protein